MSENRVIIVGAGPAGVAAALELSHRGLDAVVLDEQSQPGGQIYKNLLHNHDHAPERLQTLGEDYAAGYSLLSDFMAAKIDYRPQSKVWYLDGDKNVCYSQNGKSRRLRGDYLILATGAMERQVPLPGWDLPGVITVGALQTLLKTSGSVPEPLVLIGTGPLFYLTAWQCVTAGVRALTLLDTQRSADNWRALAQMPAALGPEGRRLLLKGLKLRHALSRSEAVTYRHVRDVTLLGDERVQQIVFSDSHGHHTLNVQWVALHQGVIPAQQITRLLGCKHHYDQQAQAAYPVTDEYGATSVENIFAVGDLGGVAGASAAVVRGQIAGLEIIRRMEGEDTTTAISQLQRRLSQLVSPRPFLELLFPTTTTDLSRSMLCRCEQVGLSAVKAVQQQNVRDPNQIKRLLRTGMGPCQGRMCASLLCQQSSAGEKTGYDDYLNIRPPLLPVTVGELADLEG